MVRLPHLLALLCGLTAALAVGCGDRSNLIPAGRAAELTQQLADLRASIAAGECDGLPRRVEAFHDDAADLGSAVDKRLRSRINQGAAALREHAVSDCQDEAARRREAATEPSDTTPPKTQTNTTTTETSTETVATDTTTTPTDTTPSDAAPPTTATTETPTTPTTPTPTPPAENGGTSSDGVTP